MNAIQRRKSRKSKRQKCQLMKQELQSRIRKIKKEFHASLEQRLVASIFLNDCAPKESSSIVSSSQKKYSHLSLQERQEIYLLRSRFWGIRAIARRLSRAPSTISRELKRNRPLSKLLGLCSYSRAKLADDIASQRRRKARERIRLGSWRTQGLVFEAIYKGLSPELASGRLFEEHKIKISHEAIYRWIYEVEKVLIEHLPRKGKKYKRGGKKRTRVQPPNQTKKLSIEKRPEAANQRLEFGHWEVDCIVSRQSNSCLIVLQERVSRFFFVEKLPNCTAKEATRAIVKLLESLDRDWLKSITCDNGAEFWDFLTVSLNLEVPVYFCHPYCSSERGAVEQRNGMLRRYFPKKTDFELVTEERLESVYQELLHRPMRCLGFLTPNEVFTGKFEPLFKRAA